MPSMEMHHIWLLRSDCEIIADLLGAKRGFSGMVRDLVHEGLERRLNEMSADAHSKWTVAEYKRQKEEAAVLLADLEALADDHNVPAEVLFGMRQQAETIDPEVLSSRDRTRLAVLFAELPTDDLLRMSDIPIPAIELPPDFRLSDDDG